MSDINQFLETKLNDAKIEIQRDYPNHKGIINIYREVIDKVDNISAFHDFFGATFIIDPNYFMGKFLKTYHKNITKLLDLQQVMDMESDVLRKYSLYDNEKIIATFPGEIAIGGGKMVGRIYLTSFRIILIGTNKSKGIPMVTTSLAGMAINKSIQKSIVKNLQAKISQITSSELPCFGHQYPMFGLQKIKLGYSTVTYKVVLETTSSSGATLKKKYLFKVKPHGINANELAKLVHDTIVETSKKFA
ncbi:MAG: hypothetical protein ACTSQU_13340 [Promethearchaeota archaeon]